MPWILIAVASTTSGLVFRSSILSFVTFGSSLSLRSSVRIGSSMSILSYSNLGSSISLREFSKFVFTKYLSLILEIIAYYGKKNN